MTLLPKYKFAVTLTLAALLAAPVAARANPVGDLLRFLHLKKKKVTLTDEAVAPPPAETEVEPPAPPPALEGQAAPPPPSADTVARRAQAQAGAQALVNAAPKTAAQFKAIGAFDVNDISILFPLDADQSLPIPELDVSATDPDLGSRLPLLHKETFANVLAHGHKVGVGDLGNDLTDWRVVGIRYDSCNPGTEDSVDGTTELDTCVQQVRLITQPFPVDKATGKRSEVDTAMHLLYYVGPNRATLAAASPELGPKNPVNTEVLRDLMAIKSASKQFGADTNGRPMGIHPGLANPRTQGTIAGMIRAFVRKHCLPQRLQIITYMGIPTGKSQPWTFIGGNIDVSRGMPVWVKDVMPNTGGADFIAFSDNAGKFVINPSPRKPEQNKKGIQLLPQGESTELIFQQDANLKALRRSGTSDGISAAGLALAANNPKQLMEIANLPNLIDNPKRHKPNDTDCFSCHSTTSRQILLKLPVQLPFKQNDVLGVFRTRGGVTGYADGAFLPKASYNVRNFGYHLDFRTKKHEPTISWLTVNSTADVADFTNLAMGFDKANGVDCGARDTNLRDLIARNCILMGASQTPPLTAGFCLRQARCTNIPADVR